jgi:LysR family transcriptional activator of nhaA
MSKLNYHHLYYFWRVAREGNLTRAADLLHVSQSALSAQIKQLESTMEVSLFNRTGRKLVLTETGIRTYAFAEEIFKKGEELEKLLRTGTEPDNQTIRIGALATMSRNFVKLFIEPLIHRPQLRFSLHSSGQARLLNALANHQLDLALTNTEVYGNHEQLWQCQLLARQPIAVVGPPGSVSTENFLQHFKQQRWVLPVNESPIRAAFDSFCAQHQLKPDIAAEADDMAMLRLLARDTGALAVIPDIVVKDELNSGKLRHLLTLPNVYENFYAVTIKRQFPNALTGELFAPWLES